MTRLDLTKAEKQTAYDEGKVLQEAQMGTIAFKFAGLHFSSNKNRHEPYSFKSRWKIIYGNSWWVKTDMILSKRVHKI